MLQGATSVVEPARHSADTDECSKGFGFSVKVEGGKVTIEPGHKLSACRWTCQRIFFCGLTLMVGQYRREVRTCCLRNVGINHPHWRDHILRAHGRDLRLEMSVRWRGAGGRYSRALRAA